MNNFKLDDFPKIDSGFKVPNGYFEQLEMEIIINSYKNVKVISIFKKTKFWLSSVAAILIIAISIVSIFSLTKNEPISNEDYLTYSNNLTTDDLIEHLSEEDISQLESSLNFYDIETTKYIKENL